MVVLNTTAYTWDWYCHLVGDRASLMEELVLMLYQSRQASENVRNKFKNQTIVH
jgi:hypothetical protein